LRSRLALAWVAGLLAGGCGLLIGLEDRELPGVGPDASPDVTSDTTRPDTGPDPGTDSGPDVAVDGGACPSTVTGCAVGCNVDGVCLDEIVSIGVGRTHSCLVRADGKIFCTGGNALAQLGTPAGGGSEKWVPVVVKNGATEVRFREISAGPSSNCAISRDGDLYCWGDNAFRQLAQPTGDKVTAPTKVNIAGLKVKAVSVGQQATCAIFDVTSPTPNVACWGHSGSGDLGVGYDTADGGDGGAFPIAEPQTVPGFRAKSIHVLDSDEDRNGRACAISESDLPFCWGSTRNNEITDTPPGTTCDPTGVSPFPCVLGPTAWAANAMRDMGNGVYDVCGLDVASSGPNRVHCKGTAGIYTRDEQCAAPAAGFFITAPDAGNPMHLATSHAARCFVNDTNDVWCFGWNGAFHSAREGSDDCAVDAGLGPQAQRPSTPFQVTFLPTGGGRDAGPGTPVKAKLLAMGRYSVLVYTPDRKLVGWGTNQEGQLGTRPAVSPTSPACFSFEGRCQGPTIIPPPAYP
jgi:hypothetical protein